MFFFHRKYTEEESVKLQSLLNDVYERFLDVVSSSRNIPKRFKGLTGEIFSSQKAEELGLIDDVKHYEDVVDELAKQTKISPKKVIEVKPKKTILG